MLIVTADARSGDCVVVAGLHETIHESLIYGGMMTILGVAIVTLRKMQRQQVVPNVDPAV